LLALGASRERRDLAADYPRELYDFDWDATFPTAPYARIDAGTMLALHAALAASPGASTC